MEDGCVCDHILFRKCEFCYKRINLKVSQKFSPFLDMTPPTSVCPWAAPNFLPSLLQPVQPVWHWKWASSSFVSVLPLKNESREEDEDKDEDHLSLTFFGSGSIYCWLLCLLSYHSQWAQAATTLLLSNMAGSKRKYCKILSSPEFLDHKCFFW